MCTVLLPQGVKLIAVKYIYIYIYIYHIISYIISYHTLSHISYIISYIISCHVISYIISYHISYHIIYSGEFVYSRNVPIIFAVFVRQCVRLFARSSPAPTGRIYVKLNIGNFYENIYPNKVNIGQNYRLIQYKGNWMSCNLVVSYQSFRDKRFNQKKVHFQQPNHTASYAKMKSLWLP
jgi:hypothetical protein